MSFDTGCALNTGLSSLIERKQISRIEPKSEEMQFKQNSPKNIMPAVVGSNPVTKIEKIESTGGLSSLVDSGLSSLVERRTISKTSKRKLDGIRFNGDNARKAKCELCEKEFVSQCNLDRHIKGNKRDKLHRFALEHSWAFYVIYRSK